MAETITQIQQPAPFIEAAAKPYLTELTSAVGDLKTQNLANQFGSQFVAGPSALQTQAQNLASGLGGFQPFLQTAAASAGPSAYQAFMSPYQTDVINTTLQDFDIQAQKGLGSIADAAIRSGAFGGAREGVAQAEYMAQSDRNRAALQAQLLQQGFGQAQQAAQQNFMNQMGLAQATPALLGQQIAGLSTLGAQQQAQAQTVLDTARAARRQIAYEPYERLSFFGQQLTGIKGGYPGATFSSAPAAGTSPTAGILGLLTGGASLATGIAGLMGNNQPQFMLPGQ